jgi:hypothetical protein
MLARTPAAQKKRRYRRRLANGITVLNVEVIETAFVEALLIADRLSEREALQRGKLAGAAEKILTEFTARWLGSDPKSRSPETQIRRR